MPQATAIFEDLLVTEKLHLLALLATWQQQALAGEPYSLEDAVSDSVFEPEPAVEEYIDSLKNEYISEVARFVWLLAVCFRDEVGPNP